MNKYFEKAKNNIFSLKSIYEIILNISAIFLLAILFYIFNEVYPIRSEFLLFIILMVSIFGYYLLARIFFGIPSTLKGEFETLIKEENPITVTDPFFDNMDNFFLIREKKANALRGIDENKIEFFIQALKDKEWDKRLKAAKILGDIKDIRAVEPLICVLKDENEDVRKAAREALEKINQ